MKLSVSEEIHEQAGYNGGFNVINELWKIMITVWVSFHDWPIHLDLYELNTQNNEKFITLQVSGLRIDTGNARLQSIIEIFGTACKQA
jgi:hypothetical protein